MTTNWYSISVPIFRRLKRNLFDWSRVFSWTKEKFIDRLAINSSEFCSANRTQFAESRIKRRVAIFYPWDDFEKKSGAGSRVTKLAKHLLEHNRDVRILCLGRTNLKLFNDIAVESYDNTHWHASELANEAFSQVVNSLGGEK